MAKQYAEVHQDDFMKFGGARLSYLDIEDALLALGGHGVSGNNFKKVVLKMAGWTGGALTTHEQRPVVAANAFNKIRDGLTKASSADELKAFLKG